MALKKYSDAKLKRWLKDAIAIYESQDKIAIGSVLRLVGSKMSLQNWTDRSRLNPEIKALYTELKELQRDRVLEIGFTNPKAARFSEMILRTNHGYIDEHQVRSIKVQEKRLEVDANQNEIFKDKILNLGFNSSFTANEN